MISSFWKINGPIVRRDGPTNRESGCGWPISRGQVGALQSGWERERERIIIVKRRDGEGGNREAEIVVGAKESELDKV